MRTTLEVFGELADRHVGYFTAAEAVERGVSSRTLAHHASTGLLEHPARGIYRLAVYPRTRDAIFVIALLWAGDGAAISHESAFFLHGLRDSPPDAVHVTISRAFRGRRKGIEVHVRPLAEEERVSVGEVMATSVDRTLADLSKGVSCPPPSELVAEAASDLPVQLARLGTQPPPPLPGGGQFDGAPFVGRHSELAFVIGLLATSRLVTLTGAPGAGKSRLALEVAAKVADQFPDGVFQVELASVPDPALVPRAVASALSVWDQPNRPMTEIVVDYLGSKRVLLVLDNCEHVLEGAAGLADIIIRSCPAVSVLVTGQAPLGVRVEKAWAVPPMSLPDPNAPLEAVASSDAVRLFCDRAAASRRGFRLNTAALAAIGEICRRVDGIPLAIELAAARVGVVTPADILARLDARFAILAGDIGQRLPRHTSMRAALEWSHSLLPAAEQVVLRRLSVFSGSCPLDAVEAICGDGDGQHHALLDPVGSLVDKSLVVADTSGALVRYRLLETLRAYAHDRLEEAGETELLRARHARWYVALAEEADLGLTGADQPAWLACLDDEHDNLLAALRWAEQGRHVEEVLRLAGALSLFWRLRGHLSEGREWLDAALQLGADGAGAPLQARALWGRSLLSLMAGDQLGCLTTGGHALDTARQAGDVRALARCLLVIANARLWREPAVALAGLHEAIEAARTCGDTWCLAHSLGLVGRAHLLLGDASAALPSLEEGLTIAREANDHQSRRLILQVLAGIAFVQRRLDDAEALLNECLGVAQELREPYAMAAALCLLGDIAITRMQLDMSDQLLGEALSLGRRAGAPDCVAGAMCSLGSLALRRNDLSKATRYFQEAVTSGREAGIDISPALRGLGEAALADGDRLTARKMCEEALALARVTNNKETIGGALHSLGLLDREEGHTKTAITRLLEALDIYHEMGDVVRTIACLDALARVATDVGRFEYAARLFGAAEGLRLRKGHPGSPATTGGYDPDLAALAEKMGIERLQAALSRGAGLSASKATAYARRGRGARGRPSSGWASLTPTEREVVAGAGEGLTNAQIGERLFISPRTVASHLSRIFVKLDARSRSQLASHQASEARRITGNLGTSTDDFPSFCDR